MARSMALTLCSLLSFSISISRYFWHGISLLRSFIFPNDRRRRAICLTGTAFHADLHIDMGLGFSLCDRIAFATRDAGSAQNAFAGYNIRHGSSVSFSEEFFIPCTSAAGSITSRIRRTCSVGGRLGKRHVFGHNRGKPHRPEDILQRVAGVNGYQLHLRFVRMKLKMALSVITRLGPPRRPGPGRLSPPVR